MHILVCVKQVPDTAEIRIDPETNTLIREGVPSVLNPYDAYALEAAARIRDEMEDTEITALSMGPEQAKQALRDCLAVAADRAYLACDRAFGGSDTLATSYVLSRAIRHVEALEGRFDLIFCGRQAIDGDTAQVGPELAEHLGCAQVTCALEAWVEQGRVRVKKEVEAGAEILAVGMPCVITFTKPGWDPRYPTLKRKLAARGAAIPTLSAADLEGLDVGRAGLKGSPTRVRRTFAPPPKAGGVRIQGADGAECARELLKRLRGAGIL